MTEAGAAPEKPVSGNQRAEDLAAVVALSKELASGQGSDRAISIDRMDRLRADDFELDIKLKQKVSDMAMKAMKWQLAVADLVFIVYASAKHWNIPPEVIESWLGAVVVQVVGVMLVVTRYLFPNRDGANPNSN